MIHFDLICMPMILANNFYLNGEKDFNSPQMINAKTKSGKSSLLNFPILLLTIMIAASCGTQVQKVDDGWIDLFNGRDLNDWVVKMHHYPPGENFDSTFRVKDGVIQVRYDHYGDFNDRFAYLF